jgi:hypothetical protein
MFKQAGSLLLRQAAALNQQPALPAGVASYSSKAFTATLFPGDGVFF